MNGTMERQRQRKKRKKKKKKSDLLSVLQKIPKAELKGGQSAKDLVKGLADETLGFAENIPVLSIPAQIAKPIVSGAMDLLGALGLIGTEDPNDTWAKSQGYDSYEDYIQKGTEQLGYSPELIPEVSTSRMVERKAKTQSKREAQIAKEMEEARKAGFSSVQAWRDSQRLIGKGKCCSNCRMERVVGVLS